jgi:hypothetical protein
LLSREAEGRFLEVKKCWVAFSIFFYDDYLYFTGLACWILWIDYLDFITVKDFLSFDSAFGLVNNSFLD